MALWCLMARTPPVLKLERHFLTFGTVEHVFFSEIDWEPCADDCASLARP